MKLLEHFKELTVHPKNAEELKGLILQLAIQGKLTKKWRELNPDVESASILLERIQEEKARLIKEKKIKKEKPLPEITEDEIPYVLPENWVWCRLGNYTHYGALEKYENKDASENTWVLELEDIEKGSSRLLKKVRFNERDFKSTKSVFNKYDVVYGKLRPYLDKVIVADEEGVCTTEMIPIKSFCACYPEYLRWFLKNPEFIEFTNSSTHGMRMPRLGTDVAKNAIISIPPSKEQKAIVSIVNQLFTEVEELEAQTKERVKLKEDFVTSALQLLATGDTTTEWAYLQQHFKTFFTEKTAVKKLRETILQLAVQGKLTHHWRTQHPNQEPATVLLEKIKAEKEQLIKEKKIKKEKPLPAITEEEIPYELPEGWVWCRMIDLCQYITDGTHQTPKYTESGRMFLSAKNVKPFRFMPEKHRFVSEEDFEGYRKNRKPEINDILLTRVGAGIGEATLIDQDLEFAIYVSVGLLKMFPDKLIPEYIVIWLNSPEGRKHSAKNTYGKGVSQGNLNLSLIRGFVVSFPPLKEQKAIVEKVNGLMFLCDALEKEIEHSTTQVEQFMQSCLKEVFE